MFLGRCSAGWEKMMKRRITVADGKLLRVLSLAWEAQFSRVERERMHKELKGALAAYVRECKAAKQNPNAQLVNCAEWELDAFKREEEGGREIAVGGRHM